MCGMTSLFLIFRTVPGLTLMDSDGLKTPEFSDQEWHPRIGCLIVIVAPPPAGAADVTARAPSTANASAAPRILFFRCMASPSSWNIGLSVGVASLIAIRWVPHTICGFTAGPLRQVLMQARRRERSIR